MDSPTPRHGGMTAAHVTVTGAQQEGSTYMKKFFGSIAVLALAAASPAMAATVNISLTGAATQNDQNAKVDQIAGAGNINIGDQLDSAVDVSATALNNMASTTVDVNQAATGAISGNGALVLAGVDNNSRAAVTQTAIALNGAGALDNTDVGVSALAGNNLGVVDIQVTQK